MLKLVEKNLSREEFLSRKEDLESNIEGNAYWGQIDEEIPFSGGAKKAICYAEETEQKEELIYTINPDGTYNIYE